MKAVHAHNIKWRNSHRKAPSRGAGRGGHPIEHDSLLASSMTGSVWKTMMENMDAIASQTDLNVRQEGFDMGNSAYEHEGSGGMGIESFRKLVDERGRLQKMLEKMHKSPVIPPSPKAKALLSATQNSGAWQLLIAVAAHLLLGQNNKSQVNRDLYDVVLGLPSSSTDGPYADRPGFVEIWEAVTNSPVQARYWFVDALREIINMPGVLASADISRIIFCRDKHGNDHEAFRRCVKKGGLAP
ncbi:hypothetical protein [Hydrogenophaga sp. 2FB]|uniref:hypothetical protein n=1 Tax=Hydrogenophaga sp. 2FB TaxID=2502187 RepID=UPI001BB1DDA8|nr:hypothetical protein [Hydrogenophaga sp. 2FB]